MTDETENLVLEPLRGMRADMGAIDKRLDGIDARLDGIDSRLEAIETQIEGWRDVFVATTGSPVTDMKDHDARIAAFEGARA
jgi:archaellum component FlaC